MAALRSLSLPPHFFPSVGKLREWQYATLAAQNCDEMRRELRGTTPPAKGRGSTETQKRAERKSNDSRNNPRADGLYNQILLLFQPLGFFFFSFRNNSQ